VLFRNCAAGTIVGLVTQPAAASYADRQTCCRHGPDAGRAAPANEFNIDAAARHGAADERASNTIIFDRIRSLNLGGPAAPRGHKVAADPFDKCGVKPGEQSAGGALPGLIPPTTDRHGDGERRGPDSSPAALIGRVLTMPGET
jgi:hypothetical protein